MLDDLLAVLPILSGYLSNPMVRLIFMDHGIILLMPFLKIFGLQ